MLTDGTLPEAKRRLVDAAGTGALVDLRAGDPDHDDPAQAINWSSTRSVRAELLVDLITGARASDGGRLKAVRLRGGCINGPLDLEAAALLCPLVLQDCSFDQPINLNEATALSVSLPGSRVPGITANQRREPRGREPRLRDPPEPRGSAEPRGRRLPIADLTALLKAAGLIAQGKR